MATKTKPKPTAAPAASKKSAGKAAKPKAEKASEESKPAAPKELYEVGTFARFTGYKSKMAKDEIVFKENDEIVIVEVNSDDKGGTVYVAVMAADYAEYLANGDDNVTGGEVAPSECAALKGAALEKARERYTPVVITGRLEKLLKKNDNVVEVAIELNQSIQESYFWLGGALAKILQEGLHLKENGGDYTGEDAFNDFCQAEFGFKASKGQQLARVYRTYSAIPGFDPSSLDAVGWSKAAIAERFVTEENVEEIIELATNTTQRELAGVLKDKYVAENKTVSGKSASRATLLKKSLNFRLDEDSADTVQLALEAFGKQNGVQDPNMQLYGIVLAWAQDHVDSDTAKKRIASKAAKAEAARAAAAAPAEEKAKPAAKPAAKGASAKKK